MIPTEDNYVQWTVEGIKRYFRRAGYKVRDYSIGQVKERKCPVDRILAAGNKIIGFQFKRPESEGPPWRWKVTPHQHDMIVQSPWIWYCLPDFVDPGLQDVALYHCRFRDGGPSDRGYLTGSGHYRWGWVATSLIACRIGVEIDKGTSAEALFAEIAENPQDAYVSLNRLGKKVYIIDRHRAVEAEGEGEHV